MNNKNQNANEEIVVTQLKQEMLQVAQGEINPQRVDPSRIESLSEPQRLAIAALEDKERLSKYNSIGIAEYNASLANDEQSKGLFAGRNTDRGLGVFIKDKLPEAEAIKKELKKRSPDMTSAGMGNLHPSPTPALAGATKSADKAR